MYRKCVVARSGPQKAWLFCAAIGSTTVAQQANAQSSVYEGWNYPAGTQSGIPTGGGSGWSVGSGYSQALGIVSPGLTHPAGLPSSGNALQTNSDVQIINLSRSLAAPLNPNQTMWMSFLARRDMDSAAYTVSLQQTSGNRIFSASFGVDVDSSSGQLRYKARWENVGFSVQGGDAFASFPLTAAGSTDLFLVRINAADSGANTQTFDMWVNPNPGSLGSPDASVVWPSSVRSWNAVRYSDRGGTVDELRIDSNIANVVSVPTPGSAILIVGTSALTIGRRRRL